MTLAKLFGWFFAAVLATECVSMLVGLARMALDDPSVDPLPGAIHMLGGMAFAILPLGLSGAAYIVCRIFRI